MKRSPFSHVFLCHASEDKRIVRNLRCRLKRDGFCTWLDSEDLLPGQRWREVITNALPKSGVVLVCLSQRACRKQGFVQREIRMAVDAAQEVPEGRIFVIPARLEPCELPDSLREWQAVDLFAKGGYDKLRLALASHSVARRLWDTAPDNKTSMLTDPGAVGELLEELHNVSGALRPSLDDFADAISNYSARFGRQPSIENAAGLCAQSRVFMATAIQAIAAKKTLSNRTVHQVAGALDHALNTKLPPQRDPLVDTYVFSIGVRRKLLETLHTKGIPAVRSQLRKQIRVIKQPKK